MFLNPSPQLQAVVTLTHAQRYVEQRFDGAWWELDRLIWSLVSDLSPQENQFAVISLDIRNQLRADRLRAE